MRSPIAELLEAVDRLDADAAAALLAPNAKVLAVDGRRAEGREMGRDLLRGFLSTLRSTSHRLTAEWHQDDVWIAEVDATYELRDWLELKALPRAFIARTGEDGIVDLRVYGAHELPLEAEYPSGEEGWMVGGRWVPPL